MTIPGLPDDLADDRQRALAVACPGCSAPAGDPCLRLDGRPLELLPAHPKRMRAAGITANLIPPKDPT